MSGMRFDEVAQLAEAVRARVKIGLDRGDSCSDGVQTNPAGIVGSLGLLQVRHHVRNASSSRGGGLRSPTASPPPLAGCVAPSTATHSGSF
mmetsp:Transcript_6614/g.17219  ORF Transcript_6614/g.17219 Transcript_6614/m.17219 type:complete len:91 (-) Transcript_6614:535-807(-)|eukprot:CAMPEP_0180016464 /NCGR_PEP_ID=MMETSP0984-20121128/19319_1 /TAXON_ID=483367 /ORGANISM="non described non described, Strain CCMP 2436" /LENGTH=90 /DNA_ID=CAMNT_0021939397 /DNA_START=125 /DNA_END=397 /DNA_ORIENTATION=+